ncbi:MAG: hypothetical protein H0T11_05820 [Chthoniobacterales bacterium]|nr:hypothetical protein [Chthoniobacterales bacterium]
MRLTLAIVAAALVALGLWLLSSGLMPKNSGRSTPGLQMSAAPQRSAGPVVLGTALLAGGGLFFIMLLRRR